MLNLYSKSIYCNQDKQVGPRPDNWFNTRLLERLEKYSWVKVTKINFEISFVTAHSPFYSGWTPHSVANNNELPLGVRSSARENKLYWRNCALSYLVQFNISYRIHKAFTMLVNDWSEESPASAHWYKEITKAKEEMNKYKTYFKQSRLSEKSQLGLRSVSSMPDNYAKKLNTLKGLHILSDTTTNNRLLVQDCVEDFLQQGILSVCGSRHEQIIHYSIKDSFTWLRALIMELVVDIHEEANKEGYRVTVSSLWENELISAFFSSVGGSASKLKTLRVLSDSDDRIKDYFQLLTTA